MNPTIKIQELQAEIDKQQQIINNCNHDFADPKYDPETVTEAYGSKLEKCGSDIWTVPEGYHQVKKDRWSRKCKICGKVEYTYTQEIAKVEYKPKFS